MLICRDCGTLFDRDEIRYWTEPHGEHLSGCPNCGGAYEEAVQCECCGEFFAQDDLIKPINFCEACLRESITPEDFAELAMESESNDYEIVGLLEDFMFTGIMGFPKQWFLNRSSLRFKQLMAREYSCMALDKNASESLTEALRDYVMRGATACADEYAEFLYERRNKNG